MLLFKKKFLELIRRGEKTQTVRLWKYCRMRGGQRSYIPGAGYIVIDAVEPITLAELTEEDAVRDGFASRVELLAEIDRLYPTEDRGGCRPYRLRFRLLPPDEQQRLIAERKAKKARLEPPADA